MRDSRRCGGGARPRPGGCAHAEGTLSRSHRLGRLGEALAARHLEAAGWRILATNFRSGRKEVDLIARKGDVIAFVEVKTRRGDGFGHPLEAVTWRKRKEIAEVARAWLEASRPERRCTLRFDAVAIHVVPGRAPRIEHVEDAWRNG